MGKQWRPGGLAFVESHPPTAKVRHTGPGVLDRQAPHHLAVGCVLFTSWVMLLEEESPDQHSYGSAAAGDNEQPDVPGRVNSLGLDR